MTDVMNVYLHFKNVADEVGELHHEILEFLVSSGTARGWFPKVPKLIKRMSEHEKEEDVRAALDKLRALHLFDSDGDRITRIVGGITHTKTPFRAMTSELVPFHLVSALDCLTIAPTLQKSVTIQTKCGVSGEPIEFSVDKEGTFLKCQPISLTAFVAGWDGTSPLGPALGAHTGFFLDDARLLEWQTTHSDPNGMPLTQDTLRMVGMEMALAIAALYVRMSIR